MPGKNTLKLSVENGYYHLYNRGVEKRSIYHDDQDYTVFLSLLKEYLSPKNEVEIRRELGRSKMTPSERSQIWHSLRRKNFNSDIRLLAYCLMPNHFHLFIRQQTTLTMNQFMGSLSASYSAYYNHKYDRVGTLYEGVYKAVLINDDGQFLHLSRYIHKQALALKDGELQEMQPSSFPEYIGTRKTGWIHPEEVLEISSQGDPSFSYRDFVKEWMNKQDEPITKLE
jgi:putative transposase